MIDRRITNSFSRCARLAILALPIMIAAGLAFMAHARAEDKVKPQPPAIADPAAATPPVIGRDVSQLPLEVQRMRQEILRAAASGDIEQLRVPIEMNELPPVFGDMKVKDAIAHFKEVSGDGEGREVLANLVDLLTTGYAITNPGTDKQMIIWPYHAAISPGEITPPQEVELYRMVSPSHFKEMKALGRYTWFRIGIGRDGVWHFFDKPS